MICDWLFVFVFLWCVVFVCVCVRLMRVCGFVEILRVMLQGLHLFVYMLCMCVRCVVYVCGVYE